MTALLIQLIETSVKGAGGLIGKEVFSCLQEVVFDKKDDLSLMKSQVRVVLDMLEELQKGQEEILERIKSIRTQIEKRVVSEHLKDSFASVLSLTTQLHSLLKVIEEGDYDGKNKLVQENYKTLAANVQLEIPQAVSRMALSDIDFLNLVRENALKNNTDVFSYHISLSFCIDKFASMYKKAIDLLEFARKDFPMLSGSIDTGNEHLEKLGEWKNCYVISSVTPLVTAFLDESTKVYNSKPCRYYMKGLKYCKPEQCLGPNNGTQRCVSACTHTDIKHPISIEFHRAEGFSLQNPILKFKVGGFHNNYVAVGNQYEGVRPRTGMLLNRSGFPDLPSDWLLQFRESTVIPPKEQNGYFCFCNTHYKTCANYEDHYVVAMEFSPSDQRFFWKLDD